MEEDQHFAFCIDLWELPDYSHERVALRDGKESCHEEVSPLTLHLVAAPGRSKLADLPLALLRPDDLGVYGNP